MSRKHCQRKVYPLLNTIQHAIAGAAITDTARLDKLRMLELSALECFKTGRATIDDWRAIADVINIAEVLARGGVGPEVLPACAAAQTVLGSVHARYQESNMIAIAEGEYLPLAEVCDYHDLQRSSISRGEYERAIKRTGDKIRGASREVKVMMEARQPRVYVDIAAVPPAQWDMHQRLENWARASRGGDKRVGQAAPMFELYRSSEARRPYGTETTVPVDQADAKKVSDGVARLDDKPRRALQWFYLRPKAAGLEAVRLGVDVARLSDLVHLGRQTLLDRGI